jgi:hypothetical protein
MCHLSVVKAIFTRTRVNVRNVCLQLPNIMLLFASCFQMTFAKSGHQLNCKVSVITCINSGIVPGLFFNTLFFRYGKTK